MRDDELRFYLQRPIAFHRAFAEVAGSAAGGLFLSQLYYWSDKGADPDGWIYKTIGEWWDETALSRAEQERARKVLTEAGILTVERRGLPARLYFRLDMAALAGALASLLNPTNKFVATPPASLPDDADQSAGSDKLLYTETTSETTQRELTPISKLRASVKPTGLGRR